MHPREAVSTQPAGAEQLSRRVDGRRQKLGYVVRSDELVQKRSEQRLLSRVLLLISAPRKASIGQFHEHSSLLGSIIAAEYVEPNGELEECVPRGRAAKFARWRSLEQIKHAVGGFAPRSPRV